MRGAFEKLLDLRDEFQRPRVIMLVAGVVALVMWHVIFFARQPWLAEWWRQTIP